ncbi:hypothetical protein Mapa_010714 [Marchantia paleacea]|nr:hypothetical protein Mapa_010714 [Marchantia paleacea]
MAENGNHVAPPHTEAQSKDTSVTRRLLKDVRGSFSWETKRNLQVEGGGFTRGSVLTQPPDLSRSWNNL